MRMRRSSPLSGTGEECSGAPRGRKLRRDQILQGRYVRRVVAAPGALCARAGRSAERRRVVKTALDREIVEPPLQLQGRFLPEVALVYLAVVADLPDDALRPVGAE